jgi:hypothetical protein
MRKVRPPQSPIMNKHLEQFREDIARGKSVVFCVKCGSTMIDQNFRYQLKCYNCGNISVWDADRFSIARDANEHDVLSGFRAAAQPPRADPGDWYDPILSSLLPLIHKLPDMPVVFGGTSRQIQREDFDELVRLWQDARTRIDAVIENLIQRDDAIDESSRPGA